MSFPLRFVNSPLVAKLVYSFVFIDAGEIGLYVLLHSTPVISLFFFLIIHRILSMKFVDFGWLGQS